MERFVFAAGAALLILLAALYGTPIVDNDGYTYYALTRSLTFDGDLNIEFDPISRQPGRLRTAEYPDAKGQRPIFSGGYALAYSPFLRVVPAIPWARVVAANLGEYRSEVPRNHALALFLGSLFFGGVTLWAVLRLLLSLYDPAPAVGATLMIFAGTPLMYYTLSAPGFAHALDACCLAVTLLMLDMCRSETRSTPIYLLLAGVFTGLAFTVRNINGVFLAVLLPAAIMALPKNLSRRLPVGLSGFLFALGFLPLAVFQLYYNKVQYGNWLHWGYMQSGVTDWTSYAIPMLVSLRRGLFVWAPVTAIALVGLLVLFRRDRWLSITGLGLILVFFSAAQFFPHWWGGTSFGLRFAVVLAAPFAAGLGEILTRFKIAGWIPGMAAVLVTFSLFHCFSTIQHDPAGLRALEASGSAYTVTDVWKIFGGVFCRNGVFPGVRGSIRALSMGHVPALVPNLAAAWRQPGTVFVTGLSGRPSGDPGVLMAGTLVCLASDPAVGVFSLSYWASLHDGDRPYSRSVMTGNYEAQVRFQQGRTRIRWALEKYGVLTLVIDGYDGPMTARRFRWVPSAGTVTTGHLECGIHSDTGSRILAKDVLN